MASNCSAGIQPATNQKSRTTSFLLFILILVTIGFRIARLTADPPADFDWSGGYFADEGFWAHNARNEVLFGNPVSDEWDARILSPIFANIQKWIFFLFGAGLVQVRIIGIFSSVFIAFSSFFLFRHQFDRGTSFFLSILISINFPMLVLGRQGILDPFSAALALGSLSLLFSQKPGFAFIAGVLLAAAYITKYLMIYTFVPIGFAVIFLRKRTSLIPFVLGFAGTAGLWLFANYIPNAELLSSYNGYYASQQSWDIVSIAINIIRQPFYLYFLKTPAILFVANLALWFFLAKPKKAGKVEKICWIWLLSGILFFALWKYRPLRYYTSLIPVLAAMAGLGLLRFEEIRSAFREHKFRWLLWLGALLPFLQTIFVLCDQWLGWNYIPKEVGVETLNAILFLLLTLLFFIPQFRWMPAAILVSFLLSDLRSYASWMAQPDYAAVEISQDLQKQVGSGVVTGQWAPELCLENHVRVVPIWKGFVNSKEPFQKYNITHVLQWEYALGGEKFGEWYPEEFKRFVPTARYRIKDSDLVLYERKNETQSRKGAKEY